jgi:anti-sigma regulatory factor (Ser/Thr protein kinase)
MIQSGICSTFKEVDLAIQQIKKSFFYTKCPKLDSKATFILFTFRELLNNGVEHGNLLDERKKVGYKICCNGKTFQIDVWDEGIGFNLPEQLMDDSMDRVLNMSSMGIFLIQKMGFQIKVNASHVTAILKLE